MTGFEERRKLTFEQAEGVEPLPAQLKPKELSPRLRALLWAAVNSSLDESVHRDPFGERVLPPWPDILYAMHIERDHGMADEFTFQLPLLKHKTKAVFATADYVKVFGWIQFVLRRRDRPHLFKERIDAALMEGRAAYRIFDGDTIVPVTSEAEQGTLRQAFADVAATEFGGARAHLRKAAESLAAGQYADSVRESIHSVESVARKLDGSADLSKALARLETSASIHGAMKKAFLALYGYTSDEQGIRHALLEPGAPAVDETDALFMIGACASFVSYLINKARAAGLLAKHSG